LKDISTKFSDVENCGHKPQIFKKFSKLLGTFSKLGRVKIIEIFSKIFGHWDILKIGSISQKYFKQFQKFSIYL
jgi:hypothetical protein